MAGRELVPPPRTNPLASDKLLNPMTPHLTPSQPHLTPSQPHLTPSQPHLTPSHVTDHGNPNLKPSYGEREHSPVRHAAPLHQGAQLGRGHLTRGDRHLAADDIGLNKQIASTHAPDHEDLDVKPVLSIIEYIVQRGKPLHVTLDTHDPEHSESYEKSFQNASHDDEIVKLLAFPINKISIEIISKCAAGGEAHAVTIGLLHTLSSYSWDAKVVIIFAAFAISYGEFWLVEQLRGKNQLAKDIAALKDLPESLDQNPELKKKFEAVFNLLQAALTATHIILRFKELPTHYINHDSAEMVSATAHIPITAYWIIRSILAAATVLLNLVGSGHEYVSSTAESWEILSLANKLSHMSEHLQQQLETLNELIDAKKRNDEYTAFKKLFETSHIDNMKILTALIRTREDQMPIFNGTRKITERLDVLRMKYVLLLISDLDLPQEELNILHLIYSQQTMPHEYEVLWVPIIDHAMSMTPTQDAQYRDLRNSMPWYSVDNPALVNPVAIRYAREEWHFTHMPILVVLDPRGRVSNHNALPVMWIWGSTAFPFVRERELALWRESTWNMELLADSIDPRIQEWIRDDKVVCLYGGEDIEWIRRFTTAARNIANTLHIPLEMMYVAKSNPKEKVRRCHDIISRDSLSHTFPVRDYYDYVWFFWVRLNSMWNSKLQHGMTVENDKIMQEIMAMLTFDSSEQGWAVFSKGLYDLTKAKGEIFLTVFDAVNEWGQRVDHPDKFVPVLDEEIRRVHPEHHCNRLILPVHTGYIPERVVCSECGRLMDKYVMYRCCTD